MTTRQTLKNKLTITITFLSLFYTAQSFGWVPTKTFIEGKIIPEYETYDYSTRPTTVIKVPAKPCTFADLNDRDGLVSGACIDWKWVLTVDDYNTINNKVDANFKTLSDKIVTSQTVLGNKVASYVHSMLIRDGSVAGTQTADDLRDLIRAIVKEEIQKALEDQK